MSENQAHPDCRICQRVAAMTPEDTVWLEKEWVVGSYQDRPGWLVANARRHADGPWSLDAAQASSFGILVKRLSAALVDLVGAERVHILAMGEHSLHFHFAMLARRPGETPVFDGLTLVAHAAEHQDRAAAQALGRQIEQKLRTAA